MAIILNNVCRRNPKNPQFFYSADKVFGAGAIAKTILRGNACRSKPLNPQNRVKYQILVLEL